MTRDGRLLKELGIRHVFAVRYLPSIFCEPVLSGRLSSRHGCYSPTEKDVNIAVQICVEAAAFAGRRGAVILRRGVTRIPVSVAAVMITVGPLHRGHHRYLLHYSVLVAAPPVDIVILIVSLPQTERS